MEVPPKGSTPEVMRVLVDHVFSEFWEFIQKVEIELPDDDIAVCPQEDMLIENKMCIIWVYLADGSKESLPIYLKNI